MTNFWMVRAGEHGVLIDEFSERGVVAIGWEELGDLTEIRDLETMRTRVRQTYPDQSGATNLLTAGVLHKFRSVISVGDGVISYGPGTREYLVGRVTGEYRYDPAVIEQYPNMRDVQWQGRVSRDVLSPSVRNSLGSSITIFEPGPDAQHELESALRGELKPEDSEVEEEEEWITIRREALDRAHEFIKDRIGRLSPEDMEQLTAALLRAMGYRTRVTPRGPDRGRDVLASPDGLGFQHPRIIAEVKHRKETIGAERIRSFLGGLRSDDRGMYVSTGGFTREARYEADRASIPITLVDLDEFAALAVEHYDDFDSEGRSLLPLIRVYWPAG